MSNFKFQGDKTPPLPTPSHEASSTSVYSCCFRFHSGLQNRQKRRRPRLEQRTHIFFSSSDGQSLSPLHPHSTLQSSPVNPNSHWHLPGLTHAPRTQPAKQNVSVDQTKNDQSAPEQRTGVNCDREDREGKNGFPILRRNAHQTDDIVVRFNRSFFFLR